MERPCYRCGTKVEEHTTFCPSCGAPQIKVAVRGDASGNEPATPPLPPGTPDSIPPPSVPVKPGLPSRIRWKRFWRLALPLAVVSGTAVAAAGLFGIVLLLVSLVVAIAVYRRDHPGPLTATQGAVLGAVMGLVSYLFVLIYATVEAGRHFSEFRQQWLDNLQQRVGTNPDPQIQQFIHWASSNQGILVLGLVSAVITAVFVGVMTGVIGAITAAASRQRR